MEKQKTCAGRVKDEWQDRREDLKTLLEAEDYETEELGSLYEYGLGIDVVEPGTFQGQRERYLRYQFSWGGPSDELRLYENGEIEYWFLDWFDGASLNVTGDKVAQDVMTWAEGFFTEWKRG